MKGGCKKGPDRKKATKIMNQAMRNTLKQDKHVEKPHFIRFFIDLSLFATNKLHLSATLEQALSHSPYIENAWLIHYAVPPFSQKPKTFGNPRGVRLRVSSNGVCPVWVQFVRSESFFPIPQNTNVKVKKLFKQSLLCFIEFQQF